MNKLNRVVLSLLLAVLAAGTAEAAGDGGPIEQSGANPTDRASVQRGAKWFVNYCLSCHSANYMRYNRLAEDLGLSEDMVMQSLVYRDAKIGEPMEIAMQPADGERWFGKTPPDLSLISRSRGADWLYTYLKSFYRDENGAWNNLVLPNAAMPHVMWQLQGIQEPVFRTETTGGEEHEVIDRLELVEPGLQSPEEFEATIRDLTAFLDYMGEPAKVKRTGIGIWVMLFLALFTLLAWLLKSEYWRDVH